MFTYIYIYIYIYIWFITTYVLSDATENVCDYPVEKCVQRRLCMHTGMFFACVLCTCVSADWILLRLSVHVYGCVGVCVRACACVLVRVCVWVCVCALCERKQCECVCARVSHHATLAPSTSSQTEIKRTRIRINTLACREIILTMHSALTTLYKPPQNFNVFLNRNQPLPVQLVSPARLPPCKHDYKHTKEG